MSYCSTVESCVAAVVSSRHESPVSALVEVYVSGMLASVSGTGNAGVLAWFGPNGPRPVFGDFVVSVGVACVTSVT